MVGGEGARPELAVSPGELAHELAVSPGDSGGVVVGGVGAGCMAPAGPGGSWWVLVGSLWVVNRLCMCE